VNLNSELKQLLRELGHAINDSVSDSDRIAEAIGRVRTAGYDVVLKLDATIGLARREAQPARITAQDRRFLEALQIRVENDLVADEPAEAVQLTPQDVRFLKSLKIRLEDDDEDSD
jgi:hypothetical protein